MATIHKYDKVYYQGKQYEAGCTCGRKIELRGYGGGCVKRELVLLKPTSKILAKLIKK